MNAVNCAATVQNDDTRRTEHTAALKAQTARDGEFILLEILFIARYFLPVLTTAGWILGFTLGINGGFFEVLSLTMVGIGLISAVTVCPVRPIKFIFQPISTGFKICRGLIPVYGLADLAVAVFGAGLGFLFGLAVAFGLPGVFTLSKFFREF